MRVINPTTLQIALLPEHLWRDPARPEWGLPVRIAVPADLAVPVPDSPTAAAISISGPTGRVTDAATDKIVPVLQEVARELSAALASQNPA